MGKRCPSCYVDLPVYVDLHVQAAMWIYKCMWIYMSMMLCGFISHYRARYYYFIRFEFERIKVGWKPEEDAPIIAMLCRHNLPAWIGIVQGIHAVVT